MVWVGNGANVPTEPRELPSHSHRSSDRFTAEKKAIGAQLRQLPQGQGWTQDKAAEATGVDWRHIQMIEAGQLNVTILTLVWLAEGFGVEVAAFFVDSAGPAESRSYPTGFSDSGISGGKSTDP